MIKGHEVVSNLLSQNMTKEAAFVSQLLMQIERDKPRWDATEFELKWLLDYIKRESHTAVSIATQEGEDDPYFVHETEWRRVQGERPTGEDRQRIVMKGCHRLASLLKGELPALRDYERKAAS